MFPDIDPELLAAYSRGEITRREIGDKMGFYVGFGAVLAGLHAHGLPLPRFPSDPNSPGVQLVQRLVEEAMARGE